MDLESEEDFRSDVTHEYSSSEEYSEDFVERLSPSDIDGSEIEIESN